MTQATRLNRRTRSQLWTRWRWFRLSLIGLLLAGLIGLVGMTGPAPAQPSPTPDASEQEIKSPPKALEVDLYGQPLFSVTASDQQTVEARVNDIKAQLESLVQSSEPIEVTTQGNQIWLNGESLLTVTQADFQANHPNTKPKSIRASDLTQAAQDWSEEINQVTREARRDLTVRSLVISLVQSAIVIAIAIGIHRLLGRLWQRFLRPFCQGLVRSDAEDADTQPSRALDLLLNLVLLLARAILWLGAALYIANLFPFARQWSYILTTILISSFTAEEINLGQKAFSTLDLLLLAVGFFGVIIAAGVLTNLLRHRVLRVSGINRGVQEVIAILVKYGLIALGTIVLLQLWGIDLSSLAILASALGVGIGFGLQDIAKNFGSGLVLVFERPIQVGDFIEVGEFMGTVERIGARSTEIQTLDQISIIIPNSRFLENEVLNWSHRNPTSRLRIPVGVAYNSDPAVVQEILIEAGRNHPNTLATPAPQVFFKEFGDSSLNFELLVWIAEPSKHVRIKSDLYFTIEALLRQHQIEIPFPQRDLHVRSGNLPIKLPPELQQFLSHWSQQNNNGQSAHRDTTRSDSDSTRPQPNRPD